MSIQENVTKLKQSVWDTAKKCGRNPEEITIVAVTKTVDASRINQAVDAGLFILGENRVQELLEKHDAVSEAAHWHIIGHLQTNKVKYIIDKVDLIHSVDSLHLAEEIDSKAKQIGKVQDILLEVNVSGEVSKFGLTIEEMPYIIEKIKELSSVRVCGLMTVAPLTDDESVVRSTFRGLKALFDQLVKDGIPLSILSMGMSGDYQIAIEEGATMIRVGSKIFGKRN